MLCKIAIFKILELSLLFLRATTTTSSPTTKEDPSVCHFFKKSICLTRRVSRYLLVDVIVGYGMSIFHLMVWNGYVIMWWVCLEWIKIWSTLGHGHECIVKSLRNCVTRVTLRWGNVVARQIAYNLWVYNALFVLMCFTGNFQCFQCWTLLIPKWNSTVVVVCMWVPVFLYQTEEEEFIELKWPFCVDNVPMVAWVCIRHGYLWW